MKESIINMMNRYDDKANLDEADLRDKFKQFIVFGDDAKDHENDDSGLVAVVESDLEKLVGCLN